jgi:hypothetical protein
MTAAKCMGSHQEIIAISMIPLDKARLFLSRTVGSCLENPFRRSDLDSIILFRRLFEYKARLGQAPFPCLNPDCTQVLYVPFISGKPVHAFHGIIRHVQLQSMFNCRASSTAEQVQLQIATRNHVMVP